MHCGGQEGKCIVGDVGRFLVTFSSRIRMLHTAKCSYEVLSDPIFILTVQQFYSLWIDFD